MKYMITGATGHLGQQVVAQLSKLTTKQSIRLGVHTPAKAAHLKDDGYEIAAIDYHNVDQMTAAFTGVNVLIYIFQSDLRRSRADQRVRKLPDCHEPGRRH